jgi:glutamate 5-kinase
MSNRWGRKSKPCQRIQLPGRGRHVHQVVAAAACRWGVPTHRQRRTAGHAGQNSGSRPVGTVFMPREQPLSSASTGSLYRQTPRRVIVDQAPAALLKNGKSLLRRHRSERDHFNLGTRWGRRRRGRLVARFLTNYRRTSCTSFRQPDLRYRKNSGLQHSEEVIHRDNMSWKKI